ncbi:MAG: allantoate amidohydrolase [Chloroflexota bacterium]
MEAASLLMQRIDLLAAISDEPGILVRRSLCPAMRRTQDLVADWCRRAGLAVREDAVGNLIGRLEGGDPTMGTFLLGSHLDTVRDAGKYDGALGVLTALAVIERLRDEGKTLPFAVETIAFTDEEGLRFHTSYLGSSAMAGVFRPEWLTMTDPQGESLAEALREYGGDPNAVADCARLPAEVRGYCEVHIEQGPVLEACGLPVGVVTGIAGQDRVHVTFQGTSGHAGTVPMAVRRDALCAAAEWILAVEGQAWAPEEVLATVGQAVVHPGASNVIPGEVVLSLDLRHPDDAVRSRAALDLRMEATAIAARRRVAMQWHEMQSSAAVPCAPALIDALARAIDACGYTLCKLASGAGHDAVPLSTLTDVAMLFVRCVGGISHNPAESVAEADVEIAIEVLYRFLVNQGEEALR